MVGLPFVGQYSLTWLEKGTLWLKKLVKTIKFKGHGTLKMKMEKWNKRLGFRMGWTWLVDFAQLVDQKVNS